MNSEKCDSIAAKAIDVMRILFFIMASSMIVFFMAGQIVYPDERDGVRENFRTYNDGWVWYKADGTSVPIAVPGDNEVEPGTYMNIQNVLPEDMNGISMVCIQTMWQDMEVYVDGELRTSYNTDDTRPFGENSAIKYVFIELKAEDAGKTIDVKTWSTTPYSGTIRDIYIGDEMSMWVHLMGKYGFKAFLEVVLIVISVTCIIICTAIRVFNKRKVPLQYLAWGIFLCAVWLFSEVRFRQIIFPNVSILSSVTFFSMMLVHVPFMLYTNDLQKGRYKPAFAVGCTFAIGVAIVLTILQVAGVADFRNTISFMHLSIILGVVLILITVIIDIKRKYTKDYKAVSLGFLGIAVGAFTETIMFYFDPGMTVGTYISLAMIFLLVMAAIKTVQDYLSTEKEKQHALLANEAKAQFLANMSHEIRTPINTIIGMNEMILRESSNEAILEYANNINNSSKLLLGLINDVLDFSKIESGQLKLICDAYNLSELIVDEVLLIESRARSKGLDMLLEVDENLPSKLYGDELRIKQIVMNLLTNAVKYTTEGSITLDVSARLVSDEVLILNIAVKDTGKGIKKENLNSLFETFTRIEEKANRNIEGTGLGLNITQRLVEKMNGEITVESEYGKGSVFTVKIPQTIMDKEPIGDIHEAHRKTVQQRAIQKESFTAPRAHVLAVDDNDMNLAVIESLLKRTLVKLDLAASGEECLKMTRKKAYDLIFMDHMMPGLDGIETLKLLRKDEGNYNKDIPVIALTANAVAGSQEFYLENGFDDYLSKPVDVVKLEQTLVKYLPDNLVTLT